MGLLLSDSFYADVCIATDKNQFGGLETINMDAVYPLGWTTIVESVALLLMEVSIVIEELPLKNREK